MMSLPALLSQVLVAFTIECDNEFEHQTPHTTSNYGSTGQGPWLASMAMWWTCMRFVGEEGIRASELEFERESDISLAIGATCCGS